MSEEPPDDQTPTPAGARSGKNSDSNQHPPLKEEPPVETRRRVTLVGRMLDYTVTTGMLPLRSDAGEIEANVFFMAYTLDQPNGTGQRPLTFAFNGGPGSSSIWLHLGALGPRRVHLNPDGTMPPPPFRLVDNDDTWLTETDLVFIDPVGTGFSRAAKPELEGKFWGYKGDIESVGEFIRLYLTRYGRWSSPLFLAGESYGTIRASGLAGHLIDRGIAFNGIILVSALLSYMTLLMDDTIANDLPYTLYLPAFTATAWYHKRLPEDLQQRELRAVLDETEEWAMGAYLVALAKGDTLSGEERAEIIARLSRYTGLVARYIDDSDLRIHIQRFCKELLRDERRTLGRLDSRFTGTDRLAVTEMPDVDPSLTSPTPPFTATFNDYIRNELGYETDAIYETLSMRVNEKWEFDSARQGYVETGDALRKAFSQNPHMQVLVACGYYDLATPFSAITYSVNHMGLHSSMRRRLRYTAYEAGHMMYIDEGERAKLKQDVSTFIRDTTSH